MMKKLGIYVHVPFCVRKCNYCDFVSYPIGPEDGRGESAGEPSKKCEGSLRSLRGGSSCPKNIASYFRALEQETKILSKAFLDLDKASCKGNYLVDSIFFGGGTPSAVDPEFICRQLDAAACLFPVDPGAEISLEANPGTLRRDKLYAYRAAGFSRISLGVQSLDDGVLKIMGRIHDAGEAEASFKLAREYFDNINLDLMMGVPGQDLESWLEGLKRVLDWEPQHLSFYSLQLEEGTPFYKDYRDGRLELPSWEENREMYHRGLELIKAAGYHHYEVSNAAKPGFECRHNLKYWNMEEYLGLGLAAHSFMEGKRFEAWELLNMESMENSSQSADAPQSPSEPSGEDFRSILTNYPPEDEKELKGDFIFTQLRLIEGLDIGLYNKLFECDFEEEFRGVLGALYEESLLERRSQKMAAPGQDHGPGEDARIAFTPKGLDQTNPVMERLLEVIG